MKTQISILVKNESLLSRFYTLFWFINIFKKMSVEVFIDSTSSKMVLKAQKDPYLIDVTPGQHQLMFADPRADNKAKYDSFTKGFYGATFGAFVSGVSGGSVVDGAVSGFDQWKGVGKSLVRDGFVSVTLNDGDVLKLSAQPKRNGSVMVTVL